MPDNVTRVYAVGPHDAQNYDVALTEKLIIARWNHKLNDLTTLRKQLEKFEKCGGLNYPPFDAALKNNPALSFHNVSEMSEERLIALHKVISEHLVEAITAAMVTEIGARNLNANGNPAAPSLLTNVIILHNKEPKNYAGILALEITELFYEPITENETVQYVLGEHCLVE